MVSNPLNFPVPSSATTGMNEMAFPPLGVIAIIASMAFDPALVVLGCCVITSRMRRSSAGPRARPTDDANPHR